MARRKHDVVDDLNRCEAWICGQQGAYWLETREHSPAMGEGRNGGDLLRGKSRKCFVGWKGVLGITEDDSLRDRCCRYRVGAFWFEIKSWLAQGRQRLWNQDEECRNVWTPGKGGRWFNNSNARDNHSNSHLDLQKKFPRSPTTN